MVKRNCEVYHVCNDRQMCMIYYLGLFSLSSELLSELKVVSLKSTLIVTLVLVLWKSDHMENK